MINGKFTSTSIEEAQRRSCWTGGEKVGEEEGERWRTRIWKGRRRKLRGGEEKEEKQETDTLTLELLVMVNSKCGRKTSNSEEQTNTGADVQRTCYWPWSCSQIAAKCYVCRFGWHTRTFVGHYTTDLRPEFVGFDLCFNSSYLYINTTSQSRRKLEIKLHTFPFWYFILRRFLSN